MQENRQEFSGMGMGILSKRQKTKGGGVNYNHWLETVVISPLTYGLIFFSAYFLHSQQEESLLQHIII